MTLLDALYAFYQEHEHCGDLDSAVAGDRVWMTCTCGAVISRRIDDDWITADGSCDPPSSAKLPPAILHRDIP